MDGRFDYLDIWDWIFVENWCKGDIIVVIYGIY